MKVGKMLAVGLGLVGLFGCETEEDDRYSEYDGIAEEEFVDRYAEGLCAFYKDCGLTSFYETCATTHRVNWSEELGAVDCRYWPEAAEACVAFVENNFPEDCEATTTGGEGPADGEPCALICYRPG